MGEEIDEAGYILKVLSDESDVEVDERGMFYHPLKSRCFFQNSQRCMEESAKRWYEERDRS